MIEVVAKRMSGTNCCERTDGEENVYASLEAADLLRESKRLLQLHQQQIEELFNKRVDEILGAVNQLSMQVIAAPRGNGKLDCVSESDGNLSPRISEDQYPSLCPKVAASKSGGPGSDQSGHAAEPPPKREDASPAPLTTNDLQDEATAAVGTRRPSQSSIASQQSCRQAKRAASPFELLSKENQQRYQRFQTIMALIIFFNAIFIGFDAQWSLSNPGKPTPAFFSLH
jgi:hypothetical protein